MSRITSIFVSWIWGGAVKTTWKWCENHGLCCAKADETRRGCHCLALSYIPRFNSSMVTFSLGTATRYLFMSAAGNQIGPGKSPSSMFMIFILPEKKETSIYKHKENKVSQIRWHPDMIRSDLPPRRLAAQRQQSSCFVEEVAVDQAFSLKLVRYYWDII